MRVILNVMRITVGVAIAFCFASSADAVSYDRHGVHDYRLGAYDMRDRQPRYQQRSHKARHHRKHKVRAMVTSDSGKVRVKARIVAHPAGCPRTRFCGCGVSLKVFGTRKRELYLAANWLRFPAAEPAPGMVAARHGHTFYILKVLKPGVVLAYDPNSGRRQTRIHVRRLAGFKVVDPRG